MAEKLLKCPSCGNSNPIGTQFCYSCRSKLFEYDQPNSNQYPGYSPTNFACPHCHAERIWRMDQYKHYYCGQCKRYIQPYTQQPYTQQPIIVQPPKATSVSAIVAGIVIFIVAIILIYAVASSLNVSIPDDQDDNEATQLGTFYRDYSWDYGGYPWSWDLNIPKQSYYEYEGRYRTLNFEYYVTENDPYIISLANGLADAARSKGYGSYETVSFVMAFVQSLPYTSDSVTTSYDEYPRYPVETLVDNGGDCEDTSILFAALLEAYPLGYDAVLFLIPWDSPNHMAVGVWGSSNLGAYVEHDGREYNYCETTGDGFKIGEIPQEYEGISVQVIEV